MTNADKFKSIFGLYATELWAKPEKDFLEWLNADAELFENSAQLDTISRQTAIDALGKDPMGGLNYESILKRLPSAQPGWIPCSKRLPKKPGQYYVSGGDKVWICEYLIIPNFIGGWCNDVANPVVQAWMPRPEPWKGEDNG